MRRHVVGVGCTAGTFSINEGMLMRIYLRIKSGVNNVDNVTEWQILNNIIAGLCDLDMATVFNKSPFL